MFQVFPGYSKVCHLAAELGFTVRRKQAFRDGNHRTALLAIIHFLAQYHLQLHNVNFVYIYKLLSARHLFVTAKEPSKVNENCLTVLQSAEGWDIATIELQAYLHRRECLSFASGLVLILRRCRQGIKRLGGSTASIRKYPRSTIPPIVRLYCIGSSRSDKARRCSAYI